MLTGWFKNPPGMHQGYFKGSLIVLQGCRKRISTRFQGHVKNTFKSFYQGDFNPVRVSLSGLRCFLISTRSLPSVKTWVLKTLKDQTLAEQNSNFKKFKAHLKYLNIQEEIYGLLSCAFPSNIIMYYNSVNFNCGTFEATNKILTQWEKSHGKFVIFVTMTIWVPSLA